MSEIKTTRAIKVGLYIKESESMKRLIWISRKQTVKK